MREQATLLIVQKPIASRELLELDISKSTAIINSIILRLQR